MALDPNATDILNNKGIVLIKLGKYDEAIQVFDKILTLDNENVGGLYNKGVALDRLGRHTEAIEYRQKALEIDPTYTGDLINRLSKTPSSPISP